MLGRLLHNRMYNYVQVFTRFARKVRYPQFILIDEGSQLVEGCESMRLTMTDFRHKLHKDKQWQPLTHVMSVDTITMAKPKEEFDISGNH